MIVPYKPKIDIVSQGYLLLTILIALTIIAFSPIALMPIPHNTKKAGKITRLQPLIPNHKQILSPRIPPNLMNLPITRLNRQNNLTLIQRMYLNTTIMGCAQEKTLAWRG